MLCQAYVCCLLPHFRTPTGGRDVADQDQGPVAEISPSASAMFWCKAWRAVSNDLTSSNHHERAQVSSKLTMVRD